MDDLERDRRFLRRLGRVYLPLIGVARVGLIVVAILIQAGVIDG